MSAKGFELCSSEGYSSVFFWSFFAKICHWIFGGLASREVLVLLLIWCQKAESQSTPSSEPLPPPNKKMVDRSWLATRWLRPSHGFHEPNGVSQCGDSWAKKIRRRRVHPGFIKGLLYSTSHTSPKKSQVQLNDTNHTSPTKIIQTNDFQ